MLHFGVLTVFLLLVKGLFLTGEFLNTLLLVEFLLHHERLHVHLLLVSFDDVLFHLKHFPSTLQFPNLFTLDVLFDLALDQFTFQHLFFHLLNVIQLEIFKLVRDSLRVVLPLAPFFFEFFTHLCVVFFEFLLFKVDPVLINFLLNSNLTGLEGLLCFPLMFNI